ncbi:MAG: hypothetical protein O3B65_00075 [Chloroflexi bacterium]|nr:hypothetical protein [Chloroflexota bacterium]
MATKILVCATCGFQSFDLRGDGRMPPHPNRDKELRALPGSCPGTGEPGKIQEVGAN